MAAVVSAAASPLLCRVLPPRCSLRPLAAAARSPAARPAALWHRVVSAAAKPDDEVERVPPALLSVLSSQEELEEESAWLADMIRCWANEEWAARELLEPHAELAEATGAAYRRLRQQADMVEYGDLVLSMGSELMSCGYDFGPTFTSPFDVANKSVELLMLRGGCDVCCTSEADRTAIQRFEAQLAEERSSSGSDAGSSG